MRVIPWTALPARLPIVGTVTFWLLFDRKGWPMWVFIVGVAVAWLLTLVLVIGQKPVSPFPPEPEAEP